MTKVQTPITAPDKPASARQDPMAGSFKILPSFMGWPFDFGEAGEPDSRGSRLLRSRPSGTANRNADRPTPVPTVAVISRSAPTAADVFIARRSATGWASTGGFSTRSGASLAGSVAASAMCAPLRGAAPGWVLILRGRCAHAPTSSGRPSEIPRHPPVRSAWAHRFGAVQGASTARTPGGAVIRAPPPEPAGGAPARAQHAPRPRRSSAPTGRLPRRGRARATGRRGWAPAGRQIRVAASLQGRHQVYATAPAFLVQSAALQSRNDGNWQEAVTSSPLPIHQLGTKLTVFLRSGP